MTFNKETIDFNLIDNIEYGRNHDGSFYIQSADYNGVEMTDDQIDELYQVAPNFAEESRFN